jgi:hypothetical protein
VKPARAPLDADSEDATMIRPDPTRRAGITLGLGVLIFLVSRFRHHLAFPEPALWIVLPTAFGLWIHGLAGFGARYGPRARALGRRGLRLTVVGIVTLTFGHLALLLHLLGPAVVPHGVRYLAGAGFVPVILGTVVLSIGALLFGLDALRGGILPRLPALPLVTGFVGIAWMLFANDSRPDGDGFEAFLAMRTLFGLCWVAIAVVLATEAVGEESPPVPAAVRSGPSS